MNRRIFQDGDKGWALNPQLGRLVPFTFKRLEMLITPEGWVVRDVLMGVCDETGDPIVVPPESSPAFGAARREFEAAQPLSPMLSSHVQVAVAKTHKGQVVPAKTAHAQVNKHTHRLTASESKDRNAPVEADQDSGG
jgi:hypothetical protein